MSWRTVVVTKRAKLELKLNSLVVRGEETKQIFLGEINTIIVENTAVSLTAALLCEISKRKIKIIFCDEKRNPQSELISYYGSHDNSSKIEKQLAWSSQTIGQVAQSILQEKINNQAAVLGKLSLLGKESLLRLAQELKINDPHNHEAHAAKIYFNNLFGMDFTRQQDNMINAALNYGYAILLSAFNRTIVANGYLTQLGIYHHSGFNHFNLSSDLMEPWRPLVDIFVFSNQWTKFENEEKMMLVNLLNSEVVIANKKQTVINALEIYCQSIFNALEKDDMSLIKFFKNAI